MLLGPGLVVSCCCCCRLQVRYGWAMLWPLSRPPGPWFSRTFAFSLTSAHARVLPQATLQATPSPSLSSGKPLRGPCQTSVSAGAARSSFLGIRALSNPFAAWPGHLSWPFLPARDASQQNQSRPSVALQSGWPLGALGDLPSPDSLTHTWAASTPHKPLPWASSELGTLLTPLLAPTLV